MRKTVKVPQAVYDRLADYSAENGVTLQEAATELLGGAFDAMGDPEVIGPEDEYPTRDESDRFGELHGRFDKLEEGMARGFAGTFAGQQEIAGQLGGDSDAVGEAQIAALEGEVAPRAFDAYARGNRAARKALHDGSGGRRR